MKKVLTFITAGILMFNLITVFEAPKVINNNTTANGIIYELDDEDHGGLRG